MTGPGVVYGLNDDQLDHPTRNPYTESGDGEQKYDAEDLLALAKQKPEEAAKKILDLWDQMKRHPAQLRREAQWKANELRRRGVPNVRIQKAENEAVYTVWVPPGATQAAPVVNHAATLCRKATSLIFSDPPAPQVSPSSGEDEDQDRAEMSERILIDLSGEGGIDDIRGARQAFDRSHTYGSGFVWYDVDPGGAGLGPQAVLASPQAQTLDDALLPGPPYVIRYVTDPQPYQAPPPPPQVAGVDPMGQPILQPVEPPPPEIKRLLTDDPAKASQVPLPKLRKEILTGRNIQMIPNVAEDIWEAQGALKGAFVPYGTLRRTMPWIEQMPEEQRKKLFTVKPAKTDGLYPAGIREGDESKGDSRLVWTVTCVYKAGGSHPKGAYLIAAGGTILYPQPPQPGTPPDPQAGTWVRSVNGVETPLDLPVTQYKAWSEGRDDPYGTASMEIVGPANETRIAQVGALLTHLDRFNNRKILLPGTSTIQPKQLQLGMGTVLYYNPGGKPEYEQVPNYPAESMQVMSLTEQAMDNSISLSDVAQGLTSPNVTSGRQAYQAVAQAHAGLSELKQNVERGYTRGCRIQLQLVRAFYTKPQRLKWATEDGQFRDKWFVGTDLGNTSDVAVQPGTLTMMTPASKMALAEEWSQAGLLRQDEAQRAVFSRLGPLIGVQDDPARLRVKRQLAEWSLGPPEQAKQDPQALQQASMKLWVPSPSDGVPLVAQIRFQEIGYFMQGVKFQRWPPEWQAGMIQEFQRMQQTLQPPPAPPQNPQAQAQLGQPPIQPEQVAGTPPGVNPAAPPLDNPVLAGRPS